MNANPPRTSPLAIVSLSFGILAYVLLPGVGAIVAVVCGHLARAEIRRAAPGNLEGDGMALAGLILGWVQIALAVIAIGLGLMFVFGSLAWSGLD